MAGPRLADGPRSEIKEGEVLEVRGSQDQILTPGQVEKEGNEKGKEDDWAGEPHLEETGPEEEQESVQRERQNGTG